MTDDPGIGDATGPPVEPPPHSRQPGAPDQDWLDGVATNDDDERRRLVRELVMRALV